MFLKLLNFDTEGSNRKKLITSKLVCLFVIILGIFYAIELSYLFEQRTNRPINQ